MTLPRLQITLAAPGIRTARLMQWVLALFSVGALAGSAIIWFESEQLEVETLERHGAVNRTRERNQLFLDIAQSQGIDLSKQRLDMLSQEVALANTLSKHHVFSWTRFLGDLETAVPPRISMKSVSLNFRDTTIALTGSAATLKDLNALVDGLEGHPAFYNVVLSSHKTTKPKGKKKGGTKPRYIAFTMKVGYNPA